MYPGLETLLSSWNNVGIVSGFLRSLRTALEFVTKRSEQATTFDTVADLSNAFYDDWVQFGDLVEIPGRLSRFSPIYFPIAYSPQAHRAFRMEGGGTYANLIMNPAPARSRLRFVDGALLAFLFPVDCPGTPRITSPLHLNRVAKVRPGGGAPVSLPWTRAEASVPVLIDQTQLDRLESKIRLRGRVRPLPQEIEGEIEGSNEDFIRLYYFAFYRDTAFPEPGFVIDARSEVGGEFRRVGSPSPFRASVSVEVGFETGLDEDDFEEALTEVLKEIDPHPEMDGTGHHYQPAYRKPGGYKIVQKSRSPLLAHLAFSKRALQFSMPIDTTSNLDHIDRWFRPSVTELCQRLAERDDDLQLETLFASDDRLDPT